MMCQFCKPTKSAWDTHEHGERISISLGMGHSGPTHVWKKKCMYQLPIVLMAPPHTFPRHILRKYW